MTKSTGHRSKGKRKTEAETRRAKGRIEKQRKEDRKQRPGRTDDKSAYGN